MSILFPLSLSLFFFKKKRFVAHTIKAAPMQKINDDRIIPFLRPHLSTIGKVMSDPTTHPA
jgi:hypothetical protein